MRASPPGSTVTWLVKHRAPTLTADSNLFELNSDPEVMRYITGGKPTPRKEIRDNIEGSEHGEVEYALTKNEWKTSGPGSLRP